MKQLLRSGSLLSYVVGFLLSLGLTLGAYALVVSHVASRYQSPSHNVVVVAVVVLGIAQLVVQLVFFLHLGREDKPRWNLLAFLFMLLVLFIVVFGSLWIMSNLNYHMMSPADAEKSIIQDEGVHH